MEPNVLFAVSRCIESKSLGFGHRVTLASIELVYCFHIGFQRGDALYCSISSTLYGTLRYREKDICLRDALIKLVASIHLFNRGEDFLDQIARAALDKHLINRRLGLDQQHWLKYVRPNHQRGANFWMVSHMLLLLVGTRM